MSIEALEGLTDEQLFSDANADEETTEQVVAEPAPEPEAQIEQPAEPIEPIVTDLPARAPVDDNAPQVPSWRVREINDEKRTLADKVAALEAEKLQWQRQQPAPQPAKEPEKVVKPDPLLDPDGYEAYLETKFEEKLLNNHRESSLANAHKTYKAEFEEAYAAAQKQVDPALKARMQSSRDPGETLMEWHREQKTRAEVGTDLNAFRQREQERLLSDPAFLAKAIEKARGVAQPSTQPGAKVPSATQLPISLTRATNAAVITSADDDDISNDGLWRHANA
jgi:hypothetical protein